MQSVQIVNLFRLKLERVSLAFNCILRNNSKTMKTSTLLALTSVVVPAAAFAPAKSSNAKNTLEASKDEILSSPNTIEFGSVWDPLGLADIGSEETLAWYRHAEVKHGRVAMAAFVGWWAVGAGLRLPGDLATGLQFSSIPSKGLEAWDAVPGWGKAQMLLFIGLIEFHDELFYSRKATHYMRGGIPGKVRKSIGRTMTSCIIICPQYFSFDDTEHGSWTFRSLQLDCPKERRSPCPGT